MSFQLCGQTGPIMAVHNKEICNCAKVSYFWGFVHVFMSKRSKKNWVSAQCSVRTKKLIIIKVRKRSILALKCTKMAKHLNTIHYRWEGRTSMFPILDMYKSLVNFLQRLLSAFPRNLSIGVNVKVIHLKYYKHFRKGAHQSHLCRQKMGWFFAD